MGINRQGYNNVCKVNESRSSTSAVDNDKYLPFILYDDLEYAEIIKDITSPTSATKSSANCEKSEKGSELRVNTVDFEELDKFIAGIDANFGDQTNFIRGKKLGNLLALIDEHHPDSNDPERRKLRQILADSQPQNSKWYDPLVPGKAELYDSLESVLSILKSFTPHCIPFLHKVSRKDVPDYHQIIKKPMDLGTMSRKLRAHQYHDKAQFVADLDLIYENCVLYNTQPDNQLRRNVFLLRDKWRLLLESIPNISLKANMDSHTLDNLIDSHLDSSKESSLSSSSHSLITSPTIRIDADLVGFWNFKYISKYPEFFPFHPLPPEPIEMVGWDGCLGRDEIETFAFPRVLLENSQKYLRLLRHNEARSNELKTQWSSKDHTNSIPVPRPVSLEHAQCIIKPSIGLLLTSLGFQSTDNESLTLLSDLLCTLIHKLLEGKDSAECVFQFLYSKINPGDLLEFVKENIVGVGRRLDFCLDTVQTSNTRIHKVYSTNQESDSKSKNEIE